jgi:hypothetical protein
MRIGDERNIDHFSPRIRCPRPIKSRHHIVWRGTLADDPRVIYNLDRTGWTIIHFVPLSLFGVVAASALVKSD